MHKRFCPPSKHHDISSRWRPVKADDEADFEYLDQEIWTNSSLTKFTVSQLNPFTVYSFTVAAVNSVGRSKPSKNSYPSVTLMESKSSSSLYVDKPEHF